MNHSKTGNEQGLKDRSQSDGRKPDGSGSNPSG